MPGRNANCRQGGNRDLHRSNQPRPFAIHVCPVSITKQRWTRGRRCECWACSTCGACLYFPGASAKVRCASHSTFVHARVHGKRLMTVIMLTCSSALHAKTGAGRGPCNQTYTASLHDGLDDHDSCKRPPACRSSRAGNAAATARLQRVATQGEHACMHNCMLHSGRWCTAAASLHIWHSAALPRCVQHYMPRCKSCIASIRSPWSWRSASSSHGKQCTQAAPRCVHACKPMSRCAG